MTQQHLPPAPPRGRRAPVWLWPAALLAASAALLCALLALLVLDRGFLVGAMRVAIIVLLIALIGALSIGL